MSNSRKMATLAVDEHAVHAAKQAQVDPEARPAQRIGNLRVIFSAGAALLAVGVAAGLLYARLPSKADVAAVSSSVQQLQIEVAGLRGETKQSSTIIIELAKRQGIQVIERPVQVLQPPFTVPVPTIRERE